MVGHTKFFGVILYTFVLQEMNLEKMQKEAFFKKVVKWKGFRQLITSNCQNNLWGIERNVYLVNEITFIPWCENGNIFGLFVKRQTRDTSSENEWEGMTTSYNEWYNKWQLMKTSGTTSENKWKRMATSDNK